MTIKEASKKLSISLYSSSPSPLVINVVGDLIRSVHMKGEDAIGQPGKIASYVVVTRQHSTIKEVLIGKVVWQGMTHEFSSSTNPIVRQSWIILNINLIVGCHLFVPFTHAMLRHSHTHIIIIAKHLRYDSAVCIRELGRAH
ncbi:hypothetical protein OROHE_023269 [Orobanche hederae]